jgi:hypothetical protein
MMRGILTSAVLGLSASAVRAAVVPHCGDITADETWAAADQHVLACQTFVKVGATLTIEAGVTVYAETVASTYPDPAPACTAAACTTANSCVFDSTASTCTPFTSVLVVEKGGTIMATGTATAPITFTANAPVADLATDLTTVSDSTTGAVTVHGTRGNWGGLIILGEAPVQGGSRNVEGLAHDVPYGGIDASDSSGTLQYVRVWHGGAAISADNEINGITFGGVGSGTTVDHCEVALNVDDGFEFFGGTVNAKYLSTLFVGDDAFDTDKGYQGKMQYLFGMIGGAGHYLAEMDGNKLAADQVFSAPQIQGVTGVGSTSSVTADSGVDAMMRLREQGAGQYSNMVLGSVPSTAVGIKHNCETGSTAPIVTQDAPIMLPETLYVSPTIVMTTMIHGDAFGVSSAANDAGCAGSDFTTAVDATADVLTTVPVAPNEANRVAGSIDLTPMGAAVDAANVEASFDGDFFDTVDYSGAFAPTGDSWLDGWSYLDCVMVSVASPSSSAVCAVSVASCVVAHPCSVRASVAGSPGRWQRGLHRPERCSAGRVRLHALRRHQYTHLRQRERSPWVPDLRQVRSDVDHCRGQHRVRRDSGLDLPRPGAGMHGSRVHHSQQLHLRQHHLYLHALHVGARCREGRHHRGRRHCHCSDHLHREGHDC